ncbi:MAG TPA: kynureninase [Gemmataceae bacterium]|nr:kynureninase [Gemmataceae bacterium]
MTLRAAELDARDPLAGFAAEFDKPPGQIYLDGNSLGLLSKTAEAALRKAVESWRSRAILGWTDGPEPWFDMSRKAATLLAPILGAEPEDVMVGQSTTVNLHQLLATYYDPLGPRPRILVDEWCFPSDRYAIESHLRLRGRDPQRDLVVVPSRDEILDEAESIAMMADGVGLAVLPSVTYRVGQLLDLRALTSAARKGGVIILWDCSHSAGVIEHRFWKDEIDFAFGCGYKYLNGGPGAVGWLYVHPWFRERLPGLAGWFGCDPARQFEMSAAFHPATDAGRFLIGTPHVLSLAPLLGSLELIDRAGVSALRAKSLMLTQLLQVEIGSRLDRFGARTITPQEDARRGGHMTLAHTQAGNLSRALRARGVIPDFRPPDLLRLCPAPLYTSFAECIRAIDILEEILRSDAHHQLPDHDARVT